MKTFTLKTLKASPSKTLLLSASVCLLSALPLSAYAAKQNENCEPDKYNYKQCDNQLGWFVGAEAGLATTSISGDELTEFYSATGINATSIDTDDSDLGAGLFLGYQVNTYLSFQAGYLSLGERSVTFKGSSTDLASYYANAEKVYPQSGEGWTANAAISLPISESFKVSAKVGLFDWEGDYVTNEVASQVGQDTIDGRDIWYGLELNYRMRDNVQLYASAARFELDRDKTNLYSLGIRYFWGTEDAQYSTDKPVIKPQQDAPKVVLALVEKDTDGDGVADSIDKCPDSNILHQVDETGCTLMLEQEFSYSLVVYFANNSAEIDSKYEQDITELVEFINTYDVNTLTVNGHTSAVGSAEFNQKLSLQRAEALAQKLSQDYALEEVKIEPIGFGETMLIDANDNEEAHIKNRRIELSISEVLSLPVNKK